MSATNPIVATYNGDANYSGTVSSTTPVNLAVTQAATTTTVSVTPAAVTFGAENAAVFVVGVSPQFAGIPTGTVTVSTGATTLCTVTLPSTTCTTGASALPGGTYAVTASYAGDPNFAASTSAPTAFVVNPAPTSTSLVLSTATVHYGASPVFTAQVSSPAGGTPTGTVTIETVVGGSTVTLCTITLPGTACTGTGIALQAAPSPYSVLAVYSGDASYLGSTSPSQNLTVNTAQSTTTIISVTPEHRGLRERALGRPRRAGAPRDHRHAHRDGDPADHRGVRHRHALHGDAVRRRRQLPDDRHRPRCLVHPLPGDRHATAATPTSSRRCRPRPA